MVNFFRKKGFTLIEILLVISIIGILAAVIFVVTGHFRMKARNYSVIHTVKQFKTWNDVYFLSHGQNFLANDCGASSCKICASKSHVNWNWPPASLLGEKDPFPKGIPSLHPYYWGGCLMYFDVYNKSGEAGYELQFSMYHVSDSEDKKMNQIFKDMFNLDVDPVDGPCEWYDNDVDMCIIQYDVDL